MTGFWGEGREYSGDQEKEIKETPLEYSKFKNNAILRSISVSKEPFYLKINDTGEHIKLIKEMLIKTKIIEPYRMTINNIFDNDLNLSILRLKKIFSLSNPNSGIITQDVILMLDKYAVFYQTGYKHHDYLELYLLEKTNLNSIDVENISSFKVKDNIIVYSSIYGFLFDKAVKYKDTDLQKRLIKGILNNIEDTENRRLYLAENKFSDVVLPYSMKTLKYRIVPDNSKGLGLYFLRKKENIDTWKYEITNNYYVFSKNNEIFKFYLSLNPTDIFKEMIKASIKLASTALKIASYKAGIEDKILDYTSLNPHILDYVIEKTREELDNSKKITYDPEQLLWEDMFYIWLFELGKVADSNGIELISSEDNLNEIPDGEYIKKLGYIYWNFDVYAKTTIDLMKHDKMDVLIKAFLLNNSKNIGYVKSTRLRVPYEFSQIEQNLAQGINMLQDMEFILGGYIFNLYLSPIKKDGTRNLSVKVHNTSTWTSATRFGFKWGENTHAGTFDAKNRGEKTLQVPYNLGGNVGWEWRWTEIIKDNKRTGHLMKYQNYEDAEF